MSAFSAKNKMPHLERFSLSVKERANVFIDSGRLISRKHDYHRYISEEHGRLLIISTSSLDYPTNMFNASCLIFS